jgi:23S rRNA pseudouridine1911/1915/1917 synthase
MVQRLDRETSGVMIFSIHQRSHRGLSSSFSGREVRKTYLALVQGSLPEQGEIRSLLARSHASNLMKSVPRGGKEAVTRFHRMEEFAGASLAEIEILTGRSHQIRVHLSEAGFPLLGDHRYGGPSSWGGKQLTRTMLHAGRLVLSHPVTKEILDLTSPLPQDMAELVIALRQESSDR